MTKPRQIALLVESSRSYGRGVLRGIAKYSQFKGNWSLRHQEMSIDSDPPAWMKRWRGDGVIARIETDAMVRMVRRLTIPVVDLRCWRKITNVPWIETDDREVVRLAVEHLWQRGVRQFAFCGFEGANYSQRRLNFFRELLATRGVTPLVYQSPGVDQITTTGAEISGMLDETGVARWLAELPSQVGVLACNDIRAQQLLIACRTVGLRVPDEIAVIGVDNDDVICPLSDPPLSSVQPDTERVGFLAAELLDLMMQGETPPREPIYVTPHGLVARRSTEVWAIDDLPTEIAYRFVRDHACEGIKVDDVAKAAGLSRRVLERRTAKHFGKTPYELIASFRMKRLKQMLTETDLTIQAIADHTGFDHVEHLHLFFKRHSGTTPGEFRQRRQ